MNQHLKQAIAAARAGKEAQAKVLLARVVKEEPDNVNAWFLLSSLADTEEQQIQHLEKVLELQPGHAAASQQLAELAPPIPEPAEDLPVFDESGADATPEMFPLPEVDVEEEDTAPEDPDEAMAWLERLAADQGAPMDELPSLTEEYDETADTLIAPTQYSVPDEVEAYEEEDTAPEDPDEAMAWLERLAADQGAPMDELPSLTDEVEEEEESFDTFIADLNADLDEEAYEEEDTAPEDPDEAMAWLERLAADQGAPMDELPTFLEEDAEDDLTEEDYSWLEGADEDDVTYLESLPTLIDEEEAEEIEEDFEAEAPAKTLTLSDDPFDVISQAEGDTIPSWLADDEDLILGDTLVTAPVEEEQQPVEPENLPDWLNELPGEDWTGDESEKSGQVVWKAGEGDDSKRPEPPTAKEKKETKPAKQTAQSKDSNFLPILYVLAAILILAILYVLIFQPL